MTVCAHNPAPGTKGCPMVEVTVAVHSGAALGVDSKLVWPLFSAILLLETPAPEVVDVF